MAENQITAALAKRDLKVAAFARQIGMSQQTLYNVVKKESIDNIGIGTFLKIAEGLGMTAEELYYGTDHTPRRPRFDDPQQEAVNGHYESLNETGRRLVAETVEAMSSSPALRAVKDGQGSADQAAMGA